MQTSFELRRRRWSSRAELKAMVSTHRKDHLSNVGTHLPHKDSGGGRDFCSALSEYNCSCLFRGTTDLHARFVSSVSRKKRRIRVSTSRAAVPTVNHLHIDHACALARGGHVTPTPSTRIASGLTLAELLPSAFSPFCGCDDALRCTAVRGVAALGTYTSHLGLGFARRAFPPWAR